MFPKPCETKIFPSNNSSLLHNVLTQNYTYTNLHNLSDEKISQDKEMWKLLFQKLREKEADHNFKITLRSLNSHQPWNSLAVSP